jgi:methionyl-tRNA formyltransferase
MNNIIIIANERVGYEATKQIIDKGYNVKAVFSSHENRSKIIADYKSFKPLNKLYTHIPFHYIETPKDPNVILTIENYNPDLIIVISWSQIIPQSILTIPVKGTVGVHYSLLPERRGGAPFTWAIMEGLSKTGLTLFFYDEGIDTGDIIDQVELEISFDDTIKNLLDKTIKILPNLLLRNLDNILNETCTRIRQEEANATYYPCRKPKDGEIDWKKTPKEIYNFIRAQTLPYPCAFSTIIDKNGLKKNLVIHNAELEEGKLLIEGIITNYE